MEYIKLAIGKSSQSPTIQGLILTTEEQHYCSSPPTSPTKTLTDDITEYLEGFDMVITEYYGVNVSKAVIKEQGDTITSMISRYVQNLKRAGVTHTYTTGISVEQLIDFRDAVKLEMERVCQKHFSARRTRTDNSLC